MQRTLLAALIGGIVVFAWGAVVHTALPIGQMGLSTLEGEAEVVALLQQKSPQPGTFFFPDLAQAEGAEHPASGPVAYLAWQPAASYGMGKNLALEFGSNVLAALMAALVVGCCAGAGSAFCRASAVMAMGVFAWLSVSASHWAWHGFSNGVFLGEGIEQASGWLLAGFAMAPLLRPRT